MAKTTFKQTDLQWIVEYDYERSTCHCSEAICRCTTIENAYIESVNVNNVINELYRKYCKAASAIDTYCFDRLCSIYEIYDKYCYNIDIGGGYYGEEVYGVYFENEEQLIKAYNEVLTQETDIEKIKYCLELEYSYLIDSVEVATTATIVDVSTKDIHLPQKEYFIKLNKEVIEEYKNRSLAVAVCTKDGDKYRLIDGYHRFIANKDRATNKIIVLE